MLLLLLGILSPVREGTVLWNPPLLTGCHDPAQHWGPGDARGSRSQQPGPSGHAEPQEGAAGCPDLRQTPGRLGGNGYQGADFRARGIVTTRQAKN